MKVLLNALQAGNRSGTGRYVEELARALPAQSPGIDLTLLWPERIPTPPLHPEAGLIRRRRTLATRIAFEQLILPRILKRLQPNIVHYPANFGPLAKVPGLVVTVHDLSFLREPAWYPPHRAAYYRWLARRSLPNAAHIIADSHATAADLQEILRIPPGRITVAHLGVDPQFKPAPEKGEALRRDYDLPESFLLYVGTIEPRKNLVRLIQAWDAAADELPDLVVAGRWGWKHAPVRAAAAAARHASRLHFPGFVAAEDLPALLTAAHAFVWPSLFEGFGLPPLEAMACGTPVLTSNTSSLPEVVGEAALLIDPNNTEDIQEGLLRIATDTALRQHCIDAGRQRASEFSWANTAQHTFSAYQKAMQTR